MRMLNVDYARVKWLPSQETNQFKYEIRNNKNPMKLYHSDTMETMPMNKKNKQNDKNAIEIIQTRLG